ncbi:MAG: NADH dehydrogenase [Sphingobacteriales bacterium]|jgi:NADH dehydrogenase
MKFEIPESNVPRIVIIGGGFGGVALAKTLKNTTYQVVILDKNNYHTFQPLLYQVATGGLEPDSIAFPIRKIFAGYHNVLFRMAEVESINSTAKEINTNRGSLSYDYLVIASGSKTNFFGNENIQQFSSPMKTVPQALDLRSLMLQNFESALEHKKIKEQDALMNIVVVGGGPTGVETAGALGELKKYVLPADYPELDLRRMKVHLIEGSSRLLNGMSDKSGNKALQFINKLDVTVWLNTVVKDFDGEKLELSNGKNLFSNTVIWAAGVQGNVVEDKMNLFVINRSRYEVDEFNELKSCSDHYALGDVAMMQSESYPMGHPMVAQVAIQQGQNIGKNFLRKIEKEPIKSFKYKDKGSMATIGKNKAVVDLNGFKFQGIGAWFVWMLVHLISLAGFRNKLVVFVNWFWNYFSYDRGTRLIIRPYKRTTQNKKAVL